MQVHPGDIIRLKDGRAAKVIHAASDDPDMYLWYAEDGHVNDSLPMETIFIGETVTMDAPVAFVSDMSEVESIISYVRQPRLQKPRLRVRLATWINSFFQ